MRGTRKKIASLLLSLSLLLSFGLTACGNPVVSSTSSSDSASDSAPGSSVDSVPEEKPKTAEEVIGELLVDEYMGTGYTPDGAEEPRYAEEWASIQAKTAPLAEGESYTEDFEKAFQDARLYPEETLYGAQAAFVDAQTGGLGDAGTNLRVTTNGPANGAFDAVLFRGMEIVPGARYRLTVTVRTNTNGCNYYLGFRGPQGDVYAFNFSGDEGQVQTLSGVAALQDTSYQGVVLMIGGNNAPVSELIIDDLKIERLVSLPVLDLRTVGSKTHLIDFEENMDYVSANNSAIERTTENAIEGYSLKISKTANWQGLDFTDMKFAVKGTYRVKFDIKLAGPGSGGAGMAFATMSSAANGSYQDVTHQINILQTVTSYDLVYTLKDYDDYFFNFSISEAGCVFMVDNIQIECISPESVDEAPAIDLTEVGAKYEQNFDSDSLEEIKKYFLEAGSVLSLIDNNGGKALQVSKAGQWNGLAFNLKFAKTGTYRVAFDIQVIKNHPYDWDNFWITLKESVKTEQIGSQLFVSADNRVPKDGAAHVELTFELTGDDYALTFSNYGADTVYWIDNFVVERTA